MKNGFKFGRVKKESRKGSIWEWMRINNDDSTFFVYQLLLSITTKK